MQESTYKYNIKCVVEYDGSMYQGFQIQPNGDTIEAHILEVLKLILKENVKISASGRTDAHVHARGQVFNFYTNKNIPLEKLQYAINNQLPLDIRIKSIEYVSLDFHARFSAIKKEYRYYIKTKPLNAFEHNYFDYQRNLDINLLKNGLELLKGSHNFEGFCSVDVDKRKDFNKTIYETKLNVKDDYLEFVFIGSGFLKYQIRRMMAVLIAVSKKEEDLSIIEEILETRNPLLFTKVANPSGLYLEKVYY